MSGTELHGTDAKTRIQARARELGFLALGVAPATVPDLERERLTAWLGKRYHGSMSWMETQKELRLDPQSLLPGARSILMGAFNYFPGRETDPGPDWISRYARGRDYHKTIRKLWRALLPTVEAELPGVRVRWFVDSAPMLEKYHAEQAGIGWRAKNANVIRKGAGSWFFLGGMLIDRELPPDTPAVDHCGSCTLCIDACPTAAIVEPMVVDSNRCISYFTIEHEGPIPDDLKEKAGEWVFGCDVCQDVCPWNRFETESAVTDFAPRADPARLTLEQAADLQKSDFDRIFRGMAVRRAGAELFQKSARRALRNRERER